MNAFVPFKVEHLVRQLSDDIESKLSIRVFKNRHPLRHVPSSTQVAVGADENDGDGLGLLVTVGVVDGCRDGE